MFRISCATGGDPFILDTQETYRKVLVAFAAKPHVCTGSHLPDHPRCAAALIVPLQQSLKTNVTPIAVELKKFMPASTDNMDL